MNLACVLWYHYQWTQIPSWKKKNKENTNLFLFRCKANTSLWNSNAIMLLLCFFFSLISSAVERTYTKRWVSLAEFLPHLLLLQLKSQQEREDIQWEWRERVTERLFTEVWAGRKTQYMTKAAGSSYLPGSEGQERKHYPEWRWSWTPGERPQDKSC